MIINKPSEYIAPNKSASDIDIMGESEYPRLLNIFTSNIELDEMKINLGNKNKQD